MLDLSLDALVVASRSADARVRGTACRVLGESIAALDSPLGSGESEPARERLRCDVGRDGRAVIVAALSDALSDRSAEVRVCAARGLCGATELEDNVTEALLRVVDDANGVFRGTVLLTLGRSKRLEESAVLGIAKALCDDDRYVRECAAMSWARYSGRSMSLVRWFLPVHVGVKDLSKTVQRLFALLLQNGEWGTLRRTVESGMTQGAGGFIEANAALRAFDAVRELDQ